jgi:hypothetical protein
VQSKSVLTAKLRELLPHLDERAQRLVLGAEARALGHGGIGVVAEAAGVSRGRVSRGVDEVADGAEQSARIRRPGAGRRRVADQDEGLMPALLALVEPGERGDPMSPLRWTTKSLRRLAGELTGAGHRIGRDAVADLLRANGFSLQGTSRTLEGVRHPDRDGQFWYISELVAAFQGAGQPVVSVDAKKKEQVGDFHQPGRDWRPGGDPVQVRSHDFPDPEAGKVIPYGVYDLTRNTGWVSVGIDHDTAAFAVETLRRWWFSRGRHDYPDTHALLVTADAGGSNSYRTRAWKARLGELAREIGMDIVVCHFPPGTSKWNKIEHRLFAHITMNWRGRPLSSHEVVVETIAATTTRTGLSVHAELDPATYPTGTTVTDEQMSTLALTTHHWHGEWNYTLHPKTIEPPPPAPSRSAARIAESDHAPDWLSHPTLTGMSTHDWDQLLSAYQQHLATQPSLSLTPRSHLDPRFGARTLSAHDRLLATVITHRWSTHRVALASIMGINHTTVARAIRETALDLISLGKTIPAAPIKATTTNALLALIGQDTAQTRH